MDNYEIHEWSQTRPVVTVCHVCTASVTVGVDAHDAGIATVGSDLTPPRPLPIRKGHHR